MAKDVSRAELAGFKVTDREPIDAALTALGVPGEELDLWTISSAYRVPQNTYNYRNILIDTGLLSKQMREATGDNFNEFSYSGQFKDQASNTILNQMALHVALAGKPLL